MKKTSGIVLLLVLAFSLVPVPAFAGKAELSLVWDGAYESNYWQRWYGEDDYYGNNSEAFIALEGNLSMSALDVSGTMTLTGPGWEMGLSGGIRKAAFNQNRSKGFELLSEAWDRLINEEADYHYYDADKHVFSVDSTVNVSAIGPQVGFEGDIRSSR
jgi:hypothetical protein